MPSPVHHTSYLRGSRQAALPRASGAALWARIHSSKAKYSAGRPRTKKYALFFLSHICSCFLFLCILLGPAVLTSKLIANTARNSPVNTIIPNQYPTGHPKKNNLAPRRARTPLKLRKDNNKARFFQAWARFARGRHS